MHEMSICLSLIDLIRAQQASHSFSSVRRVVVEIGALGHVEPDALQFCFESAAHGTLAQGSELEIRRVAGEAWCHDCVGRVEIAERGDACPECGGGKLIVQQGDEMKLKELEVV